MTAQAVLELPLDDDLFKVLSSDTRREILRLLVERRMTGTELATRLNLGKPAVAEHLKRLSDSDLILRHDDPERRWVYYELSERGRTILEPQKVRFYLVMAIAAAALLVGAIIVLGLQLALSGSHTATIGTPLTGNGGSDQGLGNLPGVGPVSSLPPSAAPLPPAASAPVVDSSKVIHNSRPAADPNAPIYLSVPVPEENAPTAGVAAPPTANGRTVAVSLALLQNLTARGVSAANATLYIQLVGQTLDTVNQTATLAVGAAPLSGVPSVPASAVTVATVPVLDSAAGTVDDTASWVTSTGNTIASSKTGTTTSGTGATAATGGSPGSLVVIAPQGGVAATGASSGATTGQGQAASGAQASSAVRSPSGMTSGGSGSYSAANAAANVAQGIGSTKGMTSATAGTSQQVAAILAAVSVGLLAAVAMMMRRD